MSMDLLQMSSSALRAYQSQLSVIGNNIANVETEGYSRQTLDLSETVDRYGEGMGVSTGTVSRCFSALSTAALIEEESTLAYYTETAAKLDELEVLNGSGSEGLSVALEEFKAALNDVASNPEDTASRTVLLQKAASLASEFNRLSDRYGEFSSALEDPSDPGAGTIGESVENINSITERMQELNKEIAAADAAGRDAPALRDERDNLVRELSGIVNASVSSNYEVTLGGQVLISADGDMQQNLLEQNATTFSVGGIDVSSSISGGALAAQSDIYTMVEDLRSNLDLLAIAFAGNMNTLFDSGYNLNATTPAAEGYTFFTGSDAGSIAVDSALYDPTNALSANPDLIVAGSTNTTGDNSVVQAMIDLLDTGLSMLGGETIPDYWANTEIALASAISEAEESAETSGLVVNMLEERAQSQSGVNLDEELVDLMTAQRSYEACSKLFSTATGMLDTLMNLV